LLHSSLYIHPLAVISILLLAVQLWCWVQAAQRIEFIAGHRAGAKGYTGELARDVDLQAAAAARMRLNGAPAAVAMGMCMVTQPGSRLTASCHTPCLLTLVQVSMSKIRLKQCKR
jgi:hypothetical protein